MGFPPGKSAQITEELCGVEFSKSTVSELCKRLDPIVTAWNEPQPCVTAVFPFSVVDALVLKVREEGRVRSRGADVGVSVSMTDGYREILGLMLGDSESEASWSEFFSWLKSRDLRGVELLSSPTIMADWSKRFANYFQGCDLATVPDPLSCATSWTLRLSRTTVVKFERLGKVDLVTGDRFIGLD
jgi:transposase-like protein